MTAPVQAAAGPLPVQRRAGGAALGGLVAIALAAIGVVALVRFAVLDEQGQQLDAAAMSSLYAGEAATRSLLSLLGTISIGSVAVALAVCVVWALIRRRWAAAAAAVLVVGGANLTTQVMKRLIARPDFGDVAGNSLPSGHTTVVTSIVLAALLIMPVGLRTIATALGSFAAVFTAASTVVAGWHRPADVLAAFAVTLAWGALAVLVLSIRRVGPASGAAGAAVAALAGAVLAGAALVGLGVRPVGGWVGVESAAVVLSAIGVAGAITVAWFARLSSAHAR